jgi:D-hydroxyproline dehydrogenase subunit beta
LCSSLPALERRTALEMPAYEQYGIHVMASQTPTGEITVGDSHEYGNVIDIFDKT